MTIEIKRENLPAVRIRGLIGTRKISSLDSSGSKTGDSSGLGNISSGIAKIATGLWGGLSGFLLGVAQRVLLPLAFSFTNLWGLFIQSSVFLYNFNWNISDEDIDANIKSIWLGYSSIVGGATGQALGFFTCGLVPSVSMFAFNPVMGAYVLERFGEEALDEMAAQLVAVINATVTSAAATGFYLTFKSARKFLRNELNPVSRLIPGLSDWGKKNGPILSAAKSVEDKVESIRNPFVRAFSENLLEEYWDGCVEAGFIVAGAADQFVAMQRYANAQQKVEVVEIIPNRKAENEVLLLSGTKQELRPMITGVLATHQLMQNRDIGDIVGYPVNEEIKAHPSEITIHFTYGTRKEPPFRVKNDTVARYKISDAKRGKIDFESLLLAAGKNGYQWGRFLAVAKLSNGRRLTAYGATSDAAKAKVMDFLPLQKADLLVINVTEETKTGNRAKNRDLNKESTQLYPQKCSIVVQLVSKLDNGKASNDGLSRLTNTYSFPLWTGEKPYNYTAEINKLFTED